MNAGVASCLLILLSSVARADLPQVNIGLEGDVTVVLPPGTHVAPQDLRTDVLMQIVSTHPIAGGVQTTLRFWPMTAGDHDLRSRLLTSDDKPLTGAPPLMVRGISSLPSQWKGALAPVSASPFSKYGGYRLFATTMVALWIVSLIPIVLVRRHRRTVVLSEIAGPAALPRNISLADLIAAHRQLSPRDRHHLEMMLIQKWRITNGLADQPINVALQRLRSNLQTAASLEQLQTWLHAPSDRSAAVDTHRLLSPYSAESPA